MVNHSHPVAAHDTAPPRVAPPIHRQERRRPPAPFGRMLLNHVVNPVVGALLRSPLHGLLSRNIVLITVTGRRTGRQYTLPVQYVRRDGEIFLLPSHPDGKSWWRTLIGGAPIQVVLRGERLTGEAIALTGRAAADERDAFQGSALERAARDATVIVHVGDLRPVR